MKYSHSWEADSSSASQKIYRILWNPKVHYRSHNSQPPVPILSHINPIILLPMRYVNLYEAPSRAAITTASSVPRRGPQSFNRGLRADCHAVIEGPNLTLVYTSIFWHFFFCLGLPKTILSIPTNPIVWQRRQNEDAVDGARSFYTTASVV